MLNARHEIPNASEALPECFDAEARSDLRPREAPSMAIWRITSHIVEGSVGGFFFARTWVSTVSYRDGGGGASNIATVAALVA